MGAELKKSIKFTEFQMGGVKVDFYRDFFVIITKGMARPQKEVMV